MIRSHLIVIGAMKAASTTLAAALRRHPEIVHGRVKELRYFDEGWKGPEGYDALFVPIPEDRDVVTLDATPRYAKTQRWPETPRRIARLRRPVHLVFILRDPVERALSHMRHSIGKGRRQAGQPVLVPQHMIDASRYSEQIAAYEAAGLGDRLLLLDFEAVCRDLEGSVAAVCRHAGLPPIALDEPIHENATTRVPASATEGLDLEALRAALAGEGERLATRHGFEPARRWSV